MQDFLLPQPYKKFMPIPSAISIPFYIGAPIAIDFCLGGAVLFFWRMFRPESAAKYGIVTGAGLMVGDGIWQLPFGILGIAKVKQVCDVEPRSMRFLPHIGTVWYFLRPQPAMHADLILAVCIRSARPTVR